MKTIVVLLVIILLLLTVGYFAYQTLRQPAENNKPKEIACTMDAKICPDGTTVGRVGPNCEFAPCPDITASWKVYENEEHGFTLKYPEEFFDANQQPTLLAGNCDFAVFPDNCPNITEIVAEQLASIGGDSRAIKNILSQPGYWDVDGKRESINNTFYCLFAAGDAAAGRAFNYYYYATVKNQKCLVIYLALTTENCDFYLPLETENAVRAEGYENCLETTAKQPILFKQIISTFKFTE